MNHKDSLIVNHLYLADGIAACRKRKMPKSVSYDDLRAAAYMGLVEAAGKFDESVGKNFPAYASSRINGAILDYLRECSWGTRSTRLKVVSIDQPVGDDGSALSEKLEDTRPQRGGEAFEKMTSPLPPLARKILRMYYVDGLKMREIAARLGVTEGRISQIVGQSTDELREAWSCREDELWSEVA